MIAGLKTGWKLVAVVAVAGLIAGTPHKSGAETLADALVGAYTTSGLLDQNRALLRAADEDVATAVSALRPILSWSGDVTRTFGNSLGSNTFGAKRSIGNTSVSAGLLAQLLLWDSGAASLGIGVAKESVLATRQTLISIEQQVLLRAVSAFMSVRSASEFVALRQNNLRLLTEELRAARDRFEVGEVTRTDVALAEARQAEARSGLATARGNLLQAQEEYKNVVGRRPGRLVPPPSLPRVERNVNTAKALAVRTHPDLRAAQHQVAASELAILRAKAQTKPVLRATGSLGVTESFNSDAYTRSGTIGLEVSGPIYQGGALSSGVRRQMAQRDAQRANLYLVRNTIEQNVGNSFAQLDAVRASLSASDERIRAARIAFRGIREEATLGARTTLDVLDAEQELLDAEAARISAQADLYVAAYSILSSMGLLTTQNLALGVQQYDPAAYYNIVKSAPTGRSKQGQKLDRVLRALQKD
ncbi:TolC family outer membrane protein [Sulfitobacter sabulilitoris]|uniref:TolC family outer membrane protein n=1 Tax=Sulfitobacter sabulilitoris TaxID=2562655 RepID=A0A5S3PLD5_9RHOB|nr:TolC family outer membrane protein [Sulfitobacter sabulilitoris]TMM55177.1 TolC family outer membrane protein [Sulfitobacter sabulilitoris]